MNQSSYAVPGQGGRYLWEERPVSVWTAPCCLALLLLWAFSAAESAPYLCLLLGVGGAVAGVMQVEYSALRARFNLQAFFIFGYVALSGVSCFYAESGSLALDDFLRLLPGFFAYFLVLLLSGRGVHVQIEAGKHHHVATDGGQSSGGRGGSRDLRGYGQCCGHRKEGKQDIRHRESPLRADHHRFGVLE